eukprot:3872400-Amphidinium_carterae.1
MSAQAGVAQNDLDQARQLLSFGFSLLVPIELTCSVSYMYSVWELCLDFLVVLSLLLRFVFSQQLITIKRCGQFQKHVWGRSSQHFLLHGNATM